MFTSAYGVCLLLYWATAFAFDTSYSYDVKDSVISIFIAMCFGFFTSAMVAAGSIGAGQQMLFSILGLLPVSFSITHLLNDIAVVWDVRNTDSDEKDWARMPYKS